MRLRAQLLHVFISAIAADLPGCGDTPAQVGHGTVCAPGFGWARFT